MTPTSRLRPRERVLMAIGHEQPDRVPFVIGVDNTTGVQYRAYRRLQAALGLSGEVRPLHGTWWELGRLKWPKMCLRRWGATLAASGTASHGTSKGGTCAARPGIRKSTSMVSGKFRMALKAGSLPSIPCRIWICRRWLRSPGRTCTPRRAWRACVRAPMHSMTRGSR